MFASDALSSVAYAPDEILLTLALAGVSAVAFSPWVGLAVMVVLLTVVASYRQNVHAYPSGGGDYEIANENLGKYAGLTVASALLVDYVLTVAVSMSSAAAYLTTAVPRCMASRPSSPPIGVVILALVNLRGIREAGSVFAVPTYIFMASILGMTAVGIFQAVTGQLGQAPSAEFDDRPRPRLRRRAGGPGRGLPAAAGLLLGRRRADRRRSHQQRRAQLQEAQEQERGHHPAAARRDRRRPCWPASSTWPTPQGPYRAGPGHGIPAERQAAGRGLHPEPGDQPDRADHLRRRIHPVLHRGRRHRRDPGVRLQYRVQRFPRARLHPGPGRLPAPPAAHPRGPAGVQQRRPGPGRRRAGADHRVQRRRHQTDPALHRGRLHLIHAEPAGHDPALGQGPQARQGPGRQAGWSSPAPSTPSASA